MSSETEAWEKYPFYSMHRRDLRISLVEERGIKITFVLFYIKEIITLGLSCKT